MALTAVLGDRLAKVGGLFPGATAPIVTARWAGPFSGLVPIPPGLAADRTLQVTPAQMVQLAASDETWWFLP